MATPDMRWIEETSDEAPACALCGAELSYDDCAECGGEGYEESWHTGPMGLENEWDACEMCGGEGGSWYCLDEHASWHRAVAMRVRQPHE